VDYHDTAGNSVEFGKALPHLSCHERSKNYNVLPERMMTFSTNHILAQLSSSRLAAHARMILFLAVSIAGAFGSTWTQLHAAELEPIKEKPILQAGLFVDTYYASSAYRPASRDRQYLTQIARDREFNINLAHIEATVAQKRLRGRVAAQFGSSVAANYQNETSTEKYSNQLSVRNIQEAYVGYQLFDKLWLDAGVFFSHIGFESWISHNNWNYTRALMAENTPYYSTGAKLTYDATPNLSLQLLVLNGWQVITAPNRDKSLGTQIAYTFSPKFRVSHSLFAGNVAPDDTSAQYRFYSNLILQYQAFTFLEFALSADAGMQRYTSIQQNKYWYTGAFYMRYLLTPKWSSALRVEYMLDRDQILNTTNTEHGFQVAGVTMNVDFMPEDAYRLRLEYRNFFSVDSIYQFSDSPRAQEHIGTLAASLKL
jgi:hypothetical protein